jgi:biotin-(acetyl-CoA carboxylase) ligase
VGLNVNQTEFSDEIAASATSLRIERGGVPLPVHEARDAVLRCIGEALAEWRHVGFSGLWPEIARIDSLNGMELSVKRTDGDKAPVHGICGGIQPDGSLLVGGERVYAGEAHVLFPSCP